MKAISGTHMRSVEAAAIQQGLVDSWAMMTIAGNALAQEAEAFRDCGAFYAVLAGKGNNAGDGFVAAKALFERG